MTSKIFPDDLDTTTLALLVLDVDKDVIHSVMDEILEYCNVDGYPLVNNSFTYNLAFLSLKMIDRATSTIPARGSILWCVLTCSAFSTLTGVATSFRRLFS